MPCFSEKPLLLRDLKEKRIKCVLQSSQTKRFNRTNTIWNHTARKKRKRANSWRVPNCKRPCVLVRWLWLFGHPSLSREYPKDWLQATCRKEWLHDVVPYNINYRWRKLAHFYVGKQLRLNFLVKIMINLCKSCNLNFKQVWMLCLLRDPHLNLSLVVRLDSCKKSFFNLL